jgi:hypothetical protein
MLLIICPLIVVVAILKIVEPMGYTTGDIRNSIPFRFAFYGLFIAAAVVAFVVSVRWLMIDRRKD